MNGREDMSYMTGGFSLSRNLYIADLHFGHNNIIRFDNRPFADVAEMNRTLFQRWNNKVYRDDQVYVIGDVQMRMKAEDVDAILRQLVGHLHLIRGNHDKKNVEWLKNFESVDDYLEIPDRAYKKDCRVVMSHYWMPFYNHNQGLAFMLHGHTHVTEESLLEENMKQALRELGRRCEAYNVGCMYQNYEPQTLEEIIERQDHKVVFEFRR